MTYEGTGDLAADSASLAIDALSSVTSGRVKTALLIADAGINLVQAGVAASRSYDAFRGGDYVGGTLNAIGATLGFGSSAVRGVQVSVPRTTGGPTYKTWNQFQSGTAGQFSSRAEAASAWRVYKEANGIVTGNKRSEAVARQYLKSLADDYRTPSWMMPWLREGRRPPGYEIDHIKPLSIGGDDLPSNMRLQGIDLHDTHHRYYRPWEW
ncbi:MAG: HNH endonuclease signature motif containing protein [Planctomycetota bacterium]